MHKAFKYRLRPTAKQTTTLVVHLEECRMLYNHFVEDRIQAYKDRGAFFGRYDQINHDETLSQAAERVASVIEKSYAGRSCSDEQKPLRS